MEQISAVTGRSGDRSCVGVLISVTFARPWGTSPLVMGWLDGLWVPHCVACDEPEVHGLCDRCARHWVVRPVEASIAGVRHAVAMTPYDSATGDRLRRAKYGGDRGVLQRLAAPFARRVAPLLRGAVDAVVPVPSSWTRRARRGFAPAAVLGRALARSLAIPMVHSLSIRPGAPNAALGAVSRRVNLRERVRAVGAAPGRIALVDDVLTTGATAEACVRELLGEDADSVVVVVLCATERLDDDSPRDTV